MNRPKWLLGALGASVLLATTGLGVAVGTDLLLVDIREEGLGGPGSGTPEMMSLAAAHGGLDRWAATDRAAVELEGTWHSPLPRWAMGAFLSDAPHIRLTFSPGDYGSMWLDELDAGRRRYHIVGDHAVEVRAEGDVEASHQVVVLARSLRHLVEMPFAMQQADVRLSAPDGTWNDTTYTRVFASWGTDEPQSDVDQYILWQSHATARLDRFDATGRFISPFSRASVRLDDHQSFEGFWLPTMITVGRGAEPGDPIMSWRIVGVTLERRSAEAKQ